MNTPAPAPGAPPRAAHPARGPWTHRALIYFFSLLFGLLIFWLLGFVLRDIASWPGPDYSGLERSRIEAGLQREIDELKNRVAEAQQAITDNRQRQTVLRDSTSNSEKTMNQLLELQRLTLQKGMRPSDAEQSALAESEQLFLANQKQYQAISDRIAELTEALRGLEERQRTLQKTLETQRIPVLEEFRRLQTRHDIKIAAVKLAFLVPLLAIAVFLFLKRRASLYAPLIYGLGLALMVKVGWVMHQHFPRRYFKYVLMGVAILLVGRILVYLLRAVAFPKPAWLLKQYREAYESFLCPVCGFPIRRGPLRYFSWTRRTLRKLAMPLESSTAPEEPYVCPVCSTALFEPCTSCQKVRHSLLPACNHCGAQKGMTGSTPGAE